MDRIMGMVIPSGFEALYLGSRPDTAKGSEHKYMYNILRLASKEVITRRWLTKEPPTVKDRIKVVQDIFVMEKLTFTLRPEQVGKFVEHLDKLHSNL